MRLQNAFTLVELIVTIAILAILAMMAAPNLSQMLHSTKVKTSSGDVLNFLQQARTEAVRLGEPITVCASTDTINCVTNNETNWAVGIITKTMRVDPSKDIVLQKLKFDNSLLVVTGPENIIFNTVGSTNDEYEVTVSIADATTYSVCVEVIGRAFKSKMGC